MCPSIVTQKDNYTKWIWPNQVSISKRGEASEISAPIDLRGSKLPVCKENHETRDDECSLEAEVLHPAATENWILLTGILEEVTEEVTALANTLYLASGDSQQRAQQMVPRFLLPDTMRQ